MTITGNNIFFISYLSGNNDICNQQKNRNTMNNEKTRSWSSKLDASSDPRFLTSSCFYIKKESVFWFISSYSSFARYFLSYAHIDDGEATCRKATMEAQTSLKFEADTHNSKISLLQFQWEIRYTTAKWLKWEEKCHIMGKAKINFKRLHAILEPWISYLS